MIRWLVAGGEHDHTSAYWNNAEFHATVERLVDWLHPMIDGLAAQCERTQAAREARAERMRTEQPFTSGWRP